MDTCLLHCTLFIYMEMKRWALQACLLVCLVQCRQWKEEKKRVRARKFSQRRICGHYFRGNKGKEEPCKRDVQCHSQSKFSSHGRRHICSEEYDCSVCTQIYGQLSAWIVSLSVIILSGIKQIESSAEKMSKKKNKIKYDCICLPTQFFWLVNYSISNCISSN